MVKLRSLLDIAQRSLDLLTDGKTYRHLAGVSRDHLATMDSLAPGIILPREVRQLALTADEVGVYFDGDGVGVGPCVGWGICDGRGDRRDLRGRFARMPSDPSVGAGATGGTDSSTHTHPIDHGHGKFDSETESKHTHTIDHNHAVATSSTPSAAASVASGALLIAASNTHTHTLDLPSEGFTSGVGSAHRHAVDVPDFMGPSGAASATDNRPSYIDLIFVERI